METEKCNAAKDFLKQVKRIDALINNKQEELDWLNGIATKVTTAWGTEMVSGTRDQDKTGDVVSKIADLRTEINREIDRFVDKRQEVNAVIEKVNDSDQMRVLRLLYIGLWDHEEGQTHYLTWKEIAEKIHVSERTAQRIHGTALQEVEKILKVDAVCH